VPAWSELVVSRFMGLEMASGQLFCFFCAFLFSTSDGKRIIVVDQLEHTRFVLVMDTHTHTHVVMHPN